MTMKRPRAAWIPARKAAPYPLSPTRMTRAPRPSAISMEPSDAKARRDFSIQKPSDLVSLRHGMTTETSIAHSAEVDSNRQMAVVVFTASINASLLAAPYPLSPTRMTRAPRPSAISMEPSDAKARRDFSIQKPSDLVSLRHGMTTETSIAHSAEVDSNRQMAVVVFTASINASLLAPPSLDLGRGPATESPEESCRR